MPALIEEYHISAFLSRPPTPVPTTLSSLNPPSHPASSYSSHNAVPERETISPTTRKLELGPSTHLAPDTLPAVLALDRLLDNRIMRHPRIHIRHKIQRQPHTKQIQHFVNERAKPPNPDSSAQSSCQP